MNKTRKTTHRSAGFSILELLLVLVILTILAGIVAFRFTGTTEKANISAAEAQLNNLKSALKRYEIAIGKYPTQQQGLEALTKLPSGVDETKWERFMDETVKNDPWGNPYVYKFPGDHNNDYDLYSWGPDGKDGTDDDITNWSKDDE